MQHGYSGLHRVRGAFVVALLATIAFCQSAPGGLTTLATFDGTNEALTTCGVVRDQQGNLYGATTFGGLNFNEGAIFKLEASNNYALTTVASFDTTTGEKPTQLDMDASGYLYGTTNGGGGGSAGNGSVFKVDPANSYALTALATFTGTSSTIGYPPVGAITDTSGNMYVTIGGGGANGAGTIIKLDAHNSYAKNILTTFDGTKGAYPFGSVIMDVAGNLYGTASGGGANNDGTVFKLDATANYALDTIATFSGSDGAIPMATLVADASGNLYGTTENGGISNHGVVFKLDARNNYALTDLAKFSGTNGDEPRSRLLIDAAGNLYGTTINGGTSNNGTIFKLDASNNYALSTLVNFDFGTNGASPYGDLIADLSGNLYGTTQTGLGAGTVFELTGSGFVVPEPSMLALLIVSGFASLRSLRQRSP